MKGAFPRLLDKASYQGATGTVVSAAKFGWGEHGITREKKRAGTPRENSGQEKEYPAQVIGGAKDGAD
jgi:hypothetical protein